jgi:predicted membrane-bound mannosyltransferase
VIAFGAMALAAMVTGFWQHRSDQTDRADLHFQSLWNPKHALAGVGVAAVIWVVLFTSFFTHASGPLDSVRSYLPWLHRAGGHSPHIHPFSYYFQRLIAFHEGKGPVWSEALILLLAGVGIVSAFTRKGLAGPEYASPRAQHDTSTDQPRNVVPHLADGGLLRPGTGALPWLVRFIAIYTLVLALAYCIISYKTPWCMLGFLHVLILLAGVGAVAFVQFWKLPVLRIASAIVLVAASAHLGYQAWRASYDYDFVANGKNPYVYAQTVLDILRLEKKVEGIAKVHPQGERMVIQVMAPDGDYWPLPWYLRRFKQVGWWDKAPAEPNSPVMIVGKKFEADLDEKSNKAWIMAGLFELRPRIYFELYVEAGLWSKYVETLPKPRD